MNLAQVKRTWSLVMEHAGDFLEIVNGSPLPVTADEPADRETAVEFLHRFASVLDGVVILDDEDEEPTAEDLAATGPRPGPVPVQAPLAMPEPPRQGPVSVNGCPVDVCGKFGHNRMMDGRPVMCVNELSWLSGVSPPTIARWVADGVLPEDAIRRWGKGGSRLAFYRDAIHRWWTAMQQVPRYKRGLTLRRGILEGRTPPPHRNTNRLRSKPVRSI